MCSSDLSPLVARGGEPVFAMEYREYTTESAFLRSDCTEGARLGFEFILKKPDLQANYILLENSVADGETHDGERGEDLGRGTHACALIFALAMHFLSRRTKNLYKTISPHNIVHFQISQSAFENMTRQQMFY